MLRTAGEVVTRLLVMGGLMRLVPIMLVEPFLDASNITKVSLVRWKSCSISHPEEQTASIVVDANIVVRNSC